MMNIFVYPSPNLSPLIKEEWKGLKSRKFNSSKRVIIPKSHDIFLINKNIIENNKIFQNKKHIDVGLDKEKIWKSSSKLVLPFESIINNQKSEKFLSENFNFSFRYNNEDERIKKKLLLKNKDNINNFNTIDSYLNKSINNLLSNEYKFIQKNKHLKKLYNNLQKYDILSNSLHNSIYRNLNQSKSMKTIFRRCCNEIIKQDYIKNKNYIEFNDNWNLKNKIRKSKNNKVLSFYD